ncbi:MAG TPA: hypothetical protein VGC19_04785 [Rhodanobacter sp.]
MRWLLLILTLFALLLAFTRHTGGAMAWWLFAGMAGAIVTGLAFAQARIAAGSREQTLSEYDLMRLREGNGLDHNRFTSER